MTGLRSCHPAQWVRPPRLPPQILLGYRTLDKQCTFSPFTSGDKEHVSPDSKHLQGPYPGQVLF